MHPRQFTTRRKPLTGLPGRNVNHKLSQGLVTFFAFDEGGGLSIYDNAGGRVGTYALPATWGVSEHGAHALMSGSIRYELNAAQRWGRVLGGAQGVTTAMRLRRTAAGGSNRYLYEMTRGSASTHKMRCYFDTTDKIFWRAIDSTGNHGSFTSTNAFTSTTEWYTIVCTADLRTGARALYVNGRNEPIADTSMNWPADASFNYLAANTRDTIGYDAQLFSDLDAEVNYFMMWRRPLSADEARSLYEEPFAMYNQPLSRRYGPAGGLGVSFYSVRLPRAAGATRVDGTDVMIVEAGSEAIAKDFAASRFDGDADWKSDSEATLMAATVEKYAGATFRIVVSGKPVPSPDLVDVRYVSQAGDALDDVGAGIVAALKTSPYTQGAAWSGGTLTVSNSADALGDRTLLVQIIPEGSISALDNTEGLPVTGITHEGSSGDDLSATLVDATVPRIIDKA